MKFDKETIKICVIITLWFVSMILMFNGIIHTDILSFILSLFLLLIASIISIILVVQVKHTNYMGEKIID